MNENRRKQKNSYSRNKEKPVQRRGRVYDSQMSADERIVNSANARKRKNRRKKLLTRAILGVIVFFASVILVIFMFFNINTITVSGDKIYSDADVVSMSGVNIGDNLIFVSGKKINAALTEKMPYIGSVKVKRHLPATIEIIITKTTAKYAVINGGTYVLIDKTGKVLEKDLTFVGDGVIVADLGEIVSAELGKTVTLKNEQAFSKLMALEKALTGCEFDGITSVNITNIYDVRLVYQGRITMILGETDDSNLTRKLDLGKEAIKTQDKENDTFCGTVNLTVNGKAYLAEETVPEETETEAPEVVTDENGSVISEENSTQNSDENTTVAA